MTDSRTKFPRIVLYGTGNYGNILVKLADMKGWPIVAAFNRAGDKVGQDLGRLAGLDKDLGIVVQDCESANYDDLDADVAIVSTTDMLDQNWPAYERLLGAGLNVICHGGQACFPRQSNAEVAARIEALAEEKGVSFMGTSLWDYSRIWSGILSLGPCIDVRAITHSTLTNVNFPRREVAQLIGIGLSVEEFEDNMRDRNYPLAAMYITVMRQVLDKAGLRTIASSQQTLPALLDEPVYSKAYQRDIPPGQAVGYRIAVTIDVQEDVSVSGSFELRILRDDETEEFRWDVDGTPSSSVVVERKDSELASASCMLGRVADIIKAKPGIRLVSELGPLTPNLC